ncbi:DUF3772 domain-containing protein [Rhodovulum adriaticum]|uniref:Small-conductance mechanosensitive channel n=1 Tax=Rhodovulum adriaticum TaxID=35804 RepID=A0A4V2SLF5_RHOAD|nr:DUF3772 domain-containing protein [Rhodovulum adriaticum]MBK1634435.1 mechanosensitive ion channel protein MscS [Rhodovulum adriaticum]TCP23196.1 small-conductance mechanosensitive channel [Rhodovulum adriaticum]
MTRMLYAILLGLGLVLIGAGPTVTPLYAQQATTEKAAIDYAEWEVIATRAEDVLAAGRASSGALEQLRSQLTDWRASFLEAQGTNAARIKTIRDQISALGPPPEEGATEPEEIAARRVELQTQLAELQAPGVRAVEAHSRADGLIREIDNIIRERQADALLNLGPSPLNPAHWPTGLRSFQETFGEIGREVGDNLRNPSARATIREDLPATLFYLLVALVLLGRGRRWMQALSVRAATRAPAGAGKVYGALVSLGQIVLPLAGVYALAAALQSSGLLGLRGDRIVQILPQLGLTVLAAMWLGGRVFADTGISHTILQLPTERQREGRINSGVIGLILALAVLLQELSEFEGYSDATRAVLAFPLLVTAGLMLSRMGQLLDAHVRGSDPSDAEERPYRVRVMRLLGRVAMAVGLGGPLLAAVGYNEAASFFVYPSILTLALLGFFLVLQRFITDAYAYALGRGKTTEDNAADALIPVLLGLVLAVLALPVLALIWGARVADLTELWSKFTAGFTLGETQISPVDFLTFAIVFAIGYTVTRLIQGTLRTTVLPKTRIDPGGQTALVSGVGYVGIFLAAVISVTTAGIDLSSLAIVAGALSVGIGFGLQTIVSNFVSGIILLIERPVSQGDWIEVGGVMGIVQDISVRSTRIQTFDKTDVIVPNADLVSGMVTNWTRQNLTGRLILTVGVAYGTDTRLVEKILQEIGESHPLVMINPAPMVVFQGFGADSLDFELRVILRDINYGLGVRTELNHQIAERFAKEGIEIPFAQRDIWVRNPEALAVPPSPLTEDNSDGKAPA